MTREWTSTIINGLILKGFTVSAGFDAEKGKMYGDDLDKISHIVCLKVQREKSFTRTEIAEVTRDVLKNNSINIFGGIASLNGNFNTMDSTIEKTNMDHPYR